jgi:Fe-S oxidoreductase
MRIDLLITCLADTLYPETGRALTRLLERLGLWGLYGVQI